MYILVNFVMQYGVVACRYDVHTYVGVAVTVVQRDTPCYEY